MQTDLKYAEEITNTPQPESSKALQSFLQCCAKIIEKTVKIGIVSVSTSNVKLFLENIWSG